MDSGDYYITKLLISKPPKMGKLASHIHTRPKTKRRNKENGEQRRKTPKVVFRLQKMP